MPRKHYFSNGELESIAKVTVENATLPRNEIICIAAKGLPPASLFSIGRYITICQNEMDGYKGYYANTTKGKYIRQHVRKLRRNHTTMPITEPVKNKKKTKKHKINLDKLDTKGLLDVAVGILCRIETKIAEGDQHG